MKAPSSSQGQLVAHSRNMRPPPPLSAKVSAPSICLSSSVLMRRVCSSSLEERCLHTQSTSSMKTTFQGSKKVKGSVYIIYSVYVTCTSLKIVLFCCKEIVFSTWGRRLWQVSCFWVIVHCVPNIPCSDSRSPSLPITWPTTALHALVTTRDRTNCRYLMNAGKPVYRYSTATVC